MDELQELMGDSYKEGMTLEDVSAFLKGKKFADLSTGNYVDKGKYENTVNDLNKQLKDKTDLLNTKLSDEEKNANASAEQAAEIERLKQLLADNTVTGNKNTVNSVMTSAREILGIESGDNEFTNFVNNITTEDTDKSTQIANYVSKVIKDSYEKGKQDALKDAMGDFGKGKGKGQSDTDDEIGKMGKRLASQNKKSDKKTYDYFA
jgi:hypothetical protein